MMLDLGGFDVAYQQVKDCFRVLIQGQLMVL